MATIANSICYTNEYNNVLMSSVATAISLKSVNSSVPCSFSSYLTNALFISSFLEAPYGLSCETWADLGANLSAAIKLANGVYNDGSQTRVPSCAWMPEPNRADSPFLRVNKR